MKFGFILCLLTLCVAGEKLKDWIKKKQPSFEKTLSLGRSHSSILDAATTAVVVALPVDSAWEKNKSLYNKLKKNGDLVEELMVSIAIALKDSTVPKSVKDVLAIQKEEGGYLDTVGGNAVKVSKKKVGGKDEIHLNWQVVSADGRSTRSEGKPIKINPKPIILEDAAIFKALSISLPPSSGI